MKLYIDLVYKIIDENVDIICIVTIFNSMGFINQMMY